MVICLCRDYNGFMLLTFFVFPQLQYYALINIRMVSSSSVTRVSMHTAKRDQKQPCFVEYIRHLHVDLYLVDSQIWGVTVACRSELCNMP